MAKPLWPVWAGKWATLARVFWPDDIGLGDTAVHIIGDARSARFKKWFEEKHGKSCGCTDRQRWLNARFPYKITGS